jgi:hypothetical protein
LHFFNEILLEGGFDPIENPRENGVSDRCYFTFNEIDVDTQVKKQTHIIQKFTNQVITLPEARIELGLDPEVDEEMMFAAIQGRVQMEISKNQAELTSDTTAQKDTQKDADKQQSAPAGQRNLRSSRRGPGNATRPTNQYGRRNSPNIRRSDLSWLGVIEKALEKDYTVVYTTEDTKDKDKQ